MQKIINGIANLPDILKEAGSRKVFLVIDSSYPFLSFKDTIESMQLEAMVKFSGFTPNPKYEQVCQGIDLFHASCCDTILAVGGGSAIDVAKCIKLAVLAKEGKNAVIPPLVSRQLDIDGDGVPFIAIPTTAGTGSESTHNAVMYYNGVKQTVVNDVILPDFAILEPSVLETLPLYQKKSTMMDALCQGIESWWSVNSTDESKEYSRRSVDLIVSHWRKYIFENDTEAASQIMLAANYGGRAISLAQTTAAHAMSYGITSMFGLPHGHAVAVCLPEIWAYMTDHMDQVTDIRGESYLATVFTEISMSLGEDGVRSAVSFFRKLMKELELANPESNQKERDIEILSGTVNPIRLRNNPISLSATVIKDLYSSIVKATLG